MIFFRIQIVSVGLLLGFFFSSSLGQVSLGTYNGCTATDADFTYTRLASDLLQPLKIVPYMQDDNSVDVYFIEKAGEFKKYSANTGEVTLLGTVPVSHGEASNSGNEDGLVGLAFDPDFKTNKKVFMMYSFSDGSESTFRI